MTKRIALLAGTAVLLVGFAMTAIAVARPLRNRPLSAWPTGDVDGGSVAVVYRPDRRVSHTNVRG